MKTVILLPTYNEKENLATMVETIVAQNLDVDILVLDDNSPDGTGKIAEELKTRYPCLDVVHRPRKEGLGKAYLDGFKKALKRGYDAMITMDCDFSHHPKYLSPMLKKAENSDLVLGSRYVPGGGVVGWALWRKILSRGGSIYARLILGLTLKDLTGGFKCYRRETLESISLQNIYSNGYSFQIETTYRIVQKGYKVKEIPIVFEDRKAGKSKMTFDIAKEAIFLVLRLKFGKTIHPN